MKITSIHQIEITSRCNLRCRYCVHPTMKRKKIDMSWKVFKKAIAEVKKLVSAGTQKELNLAGIGESTMHSEFLSMVTYARQELGPQVFMILATNGLLMTESMAIALRYQGIAVAVSAHRPEKAGPAVEICKKYGILWGVSNDPVMAAIDWAGQLKWHVSVNTTECQWQRDGKVFVMSDGRIGTCCLDGSGEDGILGHIDSFNSIQETHPYSLCATCNQTISIKPQAEVQMNSGVVYERTV